MTENGKCLPVRWIRRNRPVGAVPFVIRQDELPRGQRILAFLPHSDDGRFIGATLSLLNRPEQGQPRNRARLVVVCPGYRSVVGDLTNEEKGRLRREEALCWGRELGFGPEQLLFFGADKTYARRCIQRDEQARMDLLVREERPTMVWLTHISDTAQHANHCARKMVLDSVTRWMTEEYRRGDRGRAVFVVEYPTLYVPILPPSDKNIVVTFNDPAFTQIKQRANLCHRSQEAKYLELLGKLVEAIDVLSGADAVCEARRAGERFTRHLSEVALDPRKSRSEHLGITALRVHATGSEPVIVQERVRLPLSAEDTKSWDMHLPLPSPVTGQNGAGEANRPLVTDPDS